MFVASFVWLQNNHEVSRFFTVPFPVLCCVNPHLSSECFLDVAIRWINLFMKCYLLFIIQHYIAYLLRFLRIQLLFFHAMHILDS